MTEEAAPASAPPPAPTAAATKAGPPMLLLAGVVAGALAGGVAGGMFLVGPIVATRLAHAPAAGDAEHAPGGAHGGAGAHGATASAGRPVYRIDNLIVNPAGSQGTQFLLATVAFEVASDKTRDQLAAREVELRDVVISTLERRSLRDLTQPGARDSVRSALTAAVLPIAGAASGLRVFLPQFVIQ